MTKRTAKYQIGLTLNENEINLWEKAKKKIGYNNKQIAMLGVNVILDEDRKAIKRLVELP